MNACRASVRAARLVGQDGGAWVPMLAIAALSLALAPGGEAARAALRYGREALEAGELWRLLTAHVVHLGWPHTIMNVAALFVIRLLIADAFSARDWWLVFAVSALGIGAGLYWLSPRVDWYVGLSGVLHGVLAAGALVLLRDAPALGGLLAGGILVKLLIEQTSGPLPFTESSAGGPVIVAAHLYGAAAGAAYGALAAASRGRRARL